MLCFRIFIINDDVYSILNTSLSSSRTLLRPVLIACCHGLVSVPTRMSLSCFGNNLSKFWLGHAKKPFSGQILPF